MDPAMMLIFSLVGLIGAIWTMIMHHRPVAVPPAKSDVELKAEEAAKEEEQTAVEKHDAAVAEVKEEATKETDALTTKLEGEQENLLKDNDTLTGHLLDVGKDVRGN